MRAYVSGLRLVVAAGPALSMMPTLAMAQTPPQTQAAGPPVSGPLSGLTGDLNWLERLASVLLVVVVSWLAYRVAMGAVRRLIAATASRAQGSPEDVSKGQRAVTVLSLASNVLRWVIVFLAVIWSLAAMGVNLLPVLTGVGFVGAAIAFGSQALVRDVVTGFFILLEGQYAVGDWVDIGGKVGWVQSVGLRTTVLRDQRNLVHHIPNGSIVTATVYGRSTLRYRLLVSVEDPARAPEVAALVDRVCAAAREQLPALAGCEPAEVYQSTTGPAHVAASLSVYPTHEWVATTELTARVRAVLAATQITTPEGMAPRAEPEASELRATPPAV